MGTDRQRISRFELRDAVAENAAELANLNAASWRAAYAEILPAAFLAALDVAAWEERLRVRIDDTDSSRFTLVAVSGDRCLGFVSGGPLRDGSIACGEVYAIYVAPERCGRGAGGALLGAAEARLASGGFAQARLWVFARNRAARRFYERRGWRREPQRAYWRRGGLRRELVCYAKSLVEG